jgi:signal transduction histidine kinase/DNA-binding response OmpR family regulator
MMRKPIENSKPTRKADTPCVCLKKTYINILFVFCIGLFFLIFVASQKAQSQPFSLTTNSPHLLSDARPTDLSKGSIIIEDQNREKSFASLLRDLAQGSLTSSQNSNSIFNLGIEGHPHWIIIPLKNNSSNTQWTLSFGSWENGKMGFLKNLIIYDTHSQRTLVNFSSASQSTRTHPNSIAYNLAPSATSYLLIFAEGQKGHSAVISPELSPAQLNSPDKNPQLWLMTVFSILGEIIPIIALGLALSLFLMVRSFWAFALQVSLSLIAIYFSLNQSFLGLNAPLTPHLIPSLWLIGSLFMVIGFWRYPLIQDLFPNSLFMGLISILSVAGLTGLIILDSMTFLASSLIYGSVFIAFLLIGFLSFISGKSERDNFLFAFLPLAISVGSSVAISSSSLFLNLDVSNSLLLIIPALLLFGLFLSCMCFVVFASGSKDISSKSGSKMDLTQEDSNNSLNDLFREKRESSEHKFLLQVLEQERATMAQMQVQEAKRVEEMRKAKEMADEASRAKSAFLAVVSHEIRTPMTGIMGMVRLLLDTQLTKDQKDFVHTIQDSGEALLALLNDILDFEKIESGRMELEKIDFDLTRLLRGVHTLMTGHAAAKKITLQLDIDENLPEFVIGDPTRIRQVLLNLVNNAIKFTSHGVVKLQVKNLTTDLGSKTEIQQIYFGVQDSGIGISKEAQRKIFMPFSQADSTISRKYGGTGLGLAICKRLIEAMGSNISISSRENEGSIFFFTLSMPRGSGDGSGSLQIPAIEVEQKIDLKPSAVIPRTVMIVDDNGINQKVIAGFLHKDGHTTLLASSGFEALEKLQQVTPDIILMDIEMPGKNGVETTLDIRALPDTSKNHIPILALTGNTAIEDIQNYLKAGMQDALEKPVSPEKLASALEKYAHKGGDSHSTLPPSGIVTPAHDVISMHENIERIDMDLSEPEDSFSETVRILEQQENPFESESHAILSDLDEYGLDQKMLESLTKNLGVLQTSELMQSFYEKADELIGLIGVLYLNESWNDLKDRAHELKGMAGNFGFKQIAALSAHIEKDAKSQNKLGLKAPVEQLADSYAVSKAHLQNWLQAQADL